MEKLDISKPQGSKDSGVREIRREQLKKNKPFNSHDLTSNSPYCLPYSSCDVSLKNLVLDQLIIP